MLNNDNFTTSWNSSCEVDNNIIATFYATYTGNDVSFNINLIDFAAYQTNSSAFDSDLIAFKNRVCTAIGKMVAED